MNRATAITCLFLDIGGVLLTDGWDHLARKRAAKHFKLAWAEMEGRHHLMFETYEEGKLTSGGIFKSSGLLRKAAVHAGAVSTLHVRAIETLSRDDRVGRSAQGPTRVEDRRGQQRSARTECVSDSKVQAGRDLWMPLFPPASSTSASPTRTSFGLRWTSPRPRPSRSSLSTTPRCSSRLRKAWGFAAFCTRITSPHCAKLASFGLRNDERSHP